MCKSARRKSHAECREAKLPSNTGRGEGRNDQKARPGGRCSSAMGAMPDGSSEGPLQPAAEGPVPTNEETLLSLRGAALALSISVCSSDYLIAAKRFAVRRIGRRVLVPCREIERFVRSDHGVPKSARRKLGHQPTGLATDLQTPQAELIHLLLSQLGFAFHFVSARCNWPSQTLTQTCHRWSNVLEISKRGAKPHGEKQEHPKLA